MKTQDKSKEVSTSFQIEKVPFLIHQLIVPALFNHTSLVKYVNFIAVFYRVNSMCNWYRCPALHDLIQRSLNFLLIGTVQGWCGLVQKQYGGISENSPCDSHSLFLASWNMWTLDTDALVETGLIVGCFGFISFVSLFLFFWNQFFLTLDERQCVGFFGRVDHIIISSIIHVVNDIVLETTIK